MSDCRQEIEKLTIDKQEKKERLNNQQKTLANLSQTNQDKKRMDLECNYLSDKVLEQNMANEIDNLHKQRSELQDRTKLLKHTRDRQTQLFSDIAKVEEDLENWQSVNEEKLVGHTLLPSLRLT
jgi:hypothetical protein